MHLNKKWNICYNNVAKNAWFYLIYHERPPFILSSMQSENIKSVSLNIYISSVNIHLFYQFMMSNRQSGGYLKFPFLSLNTESEFHLVWELKSYISYVSFSLTLSFLSLWKVHFLCRHFFCHFYNFHNILFLYFL